MVETKSGNPKPKNEWKAKHGSDPLGARQSK
ncbi:hypothetical protein [Pseudomonas fluorescens]